MQPEALKNPKRRKTIIYAGMAAAILLVIVLARRSSANAGAQATTPTAQPVSNPAVDPSSYYTGGTGAGGVDYGPQLATIDTDVQTLAQAVQSAVSGAQNPGPSTPGTGGGGLDTSTLASIFTAGATTGAALAAPVAQSQPGPGNTPPAKPSNGRYLAPGAQAPSYQLTPPKNAPASARWAGPHSPGRNWVGIGGGWWRPK